MSQKKRKFNINLLLIINSINAIVISIILITICTGLCGGVTAENSSSTKDIHKSFSPPSTTVTASAAAATTTFETGFVPIPSKHHFDKIETANEKRFFNNEGAFKVFADNSQTIKKLPITVGGRQSRSKKINQDDEIVDETSKFNHQSTMQTLNSKQLQNIILQYVDEMLSRRTYEILNGLKIEIGNRSTSAQQRSSSSSSSPFSSRSNNNDLSFDEKIIDRLRRFAETHVVNLSIPRALQSTGRIFFFKGLKKFMWPIFIGMQVAKTVLLAMFLPSIIGSLGKIVGKGLSSVSGFAQPAETVDNLEFKDNYNPAMETDTKYNDYSYPQPDSTNNNFAAQMYDSATANNALSRFGIGGPKVTYVNSAMDYSRNTQQQILSNTNGEMMYSSTKKHDFKDFHDIPASSMLLTNYDPFYSPLLSRLDAVFQQMGLGPGNEKCREKLVCLMYSSPAKYAPYSNLVSAQLSRELNELKKPTSDNPDILRFFKYMRAAKDGQDQANCDINFRECQSLKETESPAMITTYNDINKLVHARKL